MKKFALIAIGALIVGQISLRTAPQSAPAQVQAGTIRGKVVREGTMDPIADVQIFVNGPSAPSPTGPVVITPISNAGTVVLNGTVVTAIAPGALRACLCRPRLQTVVGTF